MKRLDTEKLKELFKQIKEGNNYAFEDLYTEYKKMIFRIAFSILENTEEAEDVVQNVFLKIYSLDVENLPDRNESSWLYSVAKNEALMILRKKESNINIDEIYIIGNENNEIDKIIDVESYNKLISKLPKEEQEILSLKIISKFTFDEIGKLLGKSTNTIKWKYYKAIDTLKLSIGSLIMCIISFAIGCGFAGEEPKKEEGIGKQENEIVENVNNSKNYIMAENLIENETTSYIEENTYIEQSVSTSTNYIKIGFFASGVIFLVLSIIFIIFLGKYQLKLNKKASKL